MIERETERLGEKKTPIHDPPGLQQLECRRVGAGGGPEFKQRDRDNQCQATHIKPAARGKKSINKIQSACPNDPWSVDLILLAGGRPEMGPSGGGKGDRRRQAWTTGGRRTPWRRAMVMMLPLFHLLSASPESDGRRAERGCFLQCPCSPSIMKI